MQSIFCVIFQYNDNFYCTFELIHKYIFEGFYVFLDKNISSRISMLSIGIKLAFDNDVNIHKR